MEHGDLREYRLKKLEKNKLFQSTKNFLFICIKTWGNLTAIMLLINLAFLLNPNFYIGAVVISIMYVVIGLCMFFATMINVYIYYEASIDLLQFCYELVYYATDSTNPITINYNNDVTINNKTTKVMKKIYLRKNSEIEKYIRENIRCWEKEEIYESLKRGYTVGILPQEVPIEAMFILYFGNDGWHPFKFFGPKKYIQIWYALTFIIGILEYLVYIRFHWIAYVKFNGLNTNFLFVVRLIILLEIGYHLKKLRNHIWGWLELYKELLSFGLKRIC